MESTTEWLPLVRKVFLFSSFTGNQLVILTKKMSLVSYPKGAVLFQENAAGDSLYIVVSGSVRILRSGPIAAASDKDTLAYLNRGDVLGEMALLAGEPRSNTAVVDSTAELLVITKREFDALLEKNPSMAVHLSRILSSRLASIHRSGNTGAHQATKIFALLPAIPPNDQAMFALNLGLSMVEQTRRKVLLCTASDSGALMTQRLGVRAPVITENAVRDGVLQDPHLFEQALGVHPSGLEILQLESRLFAGPINNVAYAFFSLVRDLYDICIVVLPSTLHGSLSFVINDFEKVLIVAGPQSQSADWQSIRALDNMGLARKPEHVWLSTKAATIPADFPADVKFDWDSAWAERAASDGPVFLSATLSPAQRSMDRLVRKLANLTIGFAMGSGAAFGYALIGMLRVLEREGITPDVISGTSMGALIGAFHAAGIGSQELEDIACSITRRKLLSMADFIIPRTGIIRGNGVLKFLREYLGDLTFRDLSLPFACVATDIQTGKEIILDSGNVAEAVRASLSLPFFFQPYYLDGRYLVDGGLVNPVPTSIIVAQGANILLSANLTSKASERRVPGMIGWWRRHLPSMMRGPSIPEIMMKTIYIMQYEISQARSEIAHVVMNVKAHSLLWWDLDQAKKMITLGEASAEEMLPKIKSLLPFYADSCKVRLVRKVRKGF
jgi:NTE family protein